MKILKSSKVRTEEDRTLLRERVGQMIDRVREEGDAALLAYNREFDRCERKSLRISQEEVQEAYEQISEEELADLRQAAANIEAFAKAQRETVM